MPETSDPNGWRATNPSVASAVLIDFLLDLRSRADQRRVAEIDVVLREVSKRASVPVDDALSTICSFDTVPKRRRAALRRFGRHGG